MQNLTNKPMLLSHIARINGAALTGLLSLKAGLKVCKDNDILTMSAISSFALMMALLAYTLIGHIIEILSRRNPKY